MRLTLSLSAGNHCQVALNCYNLWNYGSFSLEPSDPRPLGPLWYYPLFGR